METNFYVHLFRGQGFSLWSGYVLCMILIDFSCILYALYTYIYLLNSTIFKMGYHIDSSDSV